MGQGERKESGRSHALTVAAALAMLGTSVGVNVQQLLAADPAEQLRSDQSKITPPPIQELQQSKFDSIQKKLDRNQQKFPSKQSKEPVMPGVKPVDPPR
jgi:hypothetical protein